MTKGTEAFVTRAAHAPTPSPRFVLEELLGGLDDLDEGSHLLDVGCGEGAVLAYFVEAGLPGRVTGVELDPALAARAAARVAGAANARVVAGSALDLPLCGYTHLYLFNPFDTPVLVALLDRLERQATGPVTLVHMSDNGEWPAFLGRVGWSVVREGTLALPGEEGDCPQHFTIRRYFATCDKSLRPHCHRHAGGNMKNEKVFQMRLSAVYPLLVAKAERKGRTRAEVDEVASWLTGYAPAEIAALLESDVAYGEFFERAPRPNPARALITGTVCGVRAEEVADPLMREICYLDKLVDELAKGRTMERILRG